MNRGLSFLGGLLQALVSHLVGIGSVLLIATIGWLVESGAQADWLVGLKVAGYLWFAAHGLPINFEPGQILNIPHDGFVYDVVPIGGALALLFISLGFGRRIAGQAQLWPAWLGLVLGYTLLSLGLNQLIQTPGIYLDDWRVLMQPALAYALPAVLSSLITAPPATGRSTRGGEAPERVWFANWRQQTLRRLHWGISAVLPAAGRIALSSLLAVALVSASSIALLLGFGWVNVIALYESMQLTPLGGIAVTAGQLMLLPNFILYGMAWISGVGFAIGDGSWVSPLTTELGPMPNLPFFAALPVQPWSGSLFFVLAPILAGFLLTVMSTRFLDEVRWEYATRASAAMALASVTAVLTAATAWLAAEFASGSVAPGRLSVVGITPWLFALAIGVEVGLGVLIGAVVVAAPTEGSIYSQRR